MNFNVEQEFKDYQKKLIQDEQAGVYKYNLDREYYFSSDKNFEREQMEKMKKSKSVPKKSESHVNIATFASNKKGEMGIRPEKAESSENTEKNAVGHDKASRQELHARRSLAQQYLRQRKSRSMYNIFGVL